MGNKKLPQSHARATLDEGSIGEWVDRSTLTPWKKNPRKNKHAIKPLADAIERMGFGAPIVARKSDGRVIAGHTRLLAAESLGMDRVPVRWVDVDDRTADMMALADNKLGELAEWDEPMLMAELSELGLDDAALAGWDSKDLDALARNIDSGEVVEDEAPGEDRAEELRQKYGVEKGQLWQLGEHRILCGDSTKSEDAKRVIDGRCDVMFTSPPYALGKSASLSGNKSIAKKGNAYNEHNDNANEWPSLMRGFVVASRELVDCMAINVQPLAGNKRELMRWASDNADHLVDVMVWNKGHGAPPMAKGVLTSAFELVFLLGDAGSSRTVPHSSWHGNVSAVVDVPPQRNNDFAGDHGATMPVALAAHFIGTVFDACKTVYEPFSGSGTTIIACEQLGRKCRAIELSPGYVAIALERWAVLTGREPVLLS